MMTPQVAAIEPNAAAIHDATGPQVTAARAEYTRTTNDRCISTFGITISPMNQVFDVKKIVNRAPEGRRTFKAESPYVSSKRSLGAFSRENLQPAPAGFPIGAAI